MTVMMPVLPEGQGIVRRTRKIKSLICCHHHRQIAVVARSRAALPV
jgi:hypothetical protein